MNLKHLLSDKFVDFSAKVTDVHGRIKELKAKFQAELKALTDEAEGLSLEFQNWQKEQDSPKSTATPTPEKSGVETPETVTTPTPRPRREGAA